MQDEIRLEAGKLLLFRRDGIWQARIYIGDRRYLWRSLKTSNSSDAQRAAVRLFHQTEYKLAEGLPVHQRSLNVVIDEYIAFRERDHELGKAAALGTSIKHTGTQMLRQIMRVSKFWRQYAGDKAIETVDDKLLSGYVPWRKAYYHNMAVLPKNAKLNPTDKTLQWEMMLGKALVKFAHEQGYRGNKPLPTFTFVPKIKRVRPALTLSDFTTMLRALKAYVQDAKTDKQCAIRQLLHNYVITLGLSGMRVGEANNLRLRDVEPITDADGRPNIQFNVRGKTGARIVVPHIDVRKVIGTMLERRGDVDGNELLFPMPSGERIVTLADQFNAFIYHIGLTHSASGDKYTLYSLRHFYAVRAISRDIDVYTIARNMGTSVQMIEQYYGKDATTTARARKLGGEESNYQRPQDQFVRELTEEQKRRGLENVRERRAMIKGLKKLT